MVCFYGLQEVAVAEYYKAIVLGSCCVSQTYHDHELHGLHRGRRRPKLGNSEVLNNESLISLEFAQNSCVLQDLHPSKFILEDRIDRERLYVCLKMLG
jgi:hypothetical protein